ERELLRARAGRVVRADSRLAASRGRPRVFQQRLGGLRGSERARVAGAARRGNEGSVTDALLLVDVLKDFRHEDGEALLESYRRRHSALVSLLEDARARGLPV